MTKLHIQMGHCKRLDLVRTLASYGATGPALMAANHLKCESCGRNQPVARDRPASLPRGVGQFNDLIRADGFFVGAIEDKTIHLVGLIDDVTSMHIVFRITDQVPELVFNGVRDFWPMPFGIPLEFVCDQDGMFEGSFSERLSRQSRLVRYVLSGAHITSSAKWSGTTTSGGAPSSASWSNGPSPTTRTSTTPFAR